MVSDAQKKATAEYRKRKPVIRRQLVFQPGKYDEELAHLDAQKNRVGYVSSLIRMDMEHHMDQYACDYYARHLVAVAFESGHYARLSMNFELGRYVATVFAIEEFARLTGTPMDCYGITRKGILLDVCRTLDEAIKVANERAEADKRLHNVFEVHDMSQPGYGVSERGEALHVAGGE